MVKEISDKYGTDIDWVTMNRKHNFEDFRTVTRESKFDNYVQRLVLHVLIFSIILMLTCKLHLF